MQKSCKNCTKTFEITDDDFKFYDKVSPVFNGQKHSVPPPTLCPDCRQQRRLAFRNERKLYKRKCDATGKEIISMYSPDKPFKVYDQTEWWSDRWDPLEYGRDFDSNRPFFEQFKELMQEVPKISLINKEAENSEYCNFAWRNKNSYLTFTCGSCEDSFYSNRSFNSKNICDCSNVSDCELGYEMLDSNNCYNCTFLQNCSNCTDCFFGYNLKGCKNCFGCAGLIQAEYCIGNKKYPEQEYKEKVAMLLGDLNNIKEKYKKYKDSLERKYIDGMNLENCTGDAIYNSKNILNCFEVKHSQDCHFICNATHLKDCYDVNNDDNSELVYEAVGSESNYQHLFNDICWFDKEIILCSSCFNSHNLFGCVGAKHKQYCILNRKYPKEEYEALVPKIIEHMRHTGEWGEFFQISISPFAYNETIAQEYFPMTKEDALKKTYNWQNAPVETPNLGVSTKVDIPDDIKDVPDSITKEILTCENCQKNYKIIPQELKFYQQMNLPIPYKCPDCRHFNRMKLRNPRQLWKRNCLKCNAEIQTTYAPERPEIVYCERCYLETVY